MRPATVLDAVVPGSNKLRKGGYAMVISVRVSDEAGNLMKEYAEMKGLTVSQLLRMAVQERLETEYRFYSDRMEVMREKPIYTVKKKKKLK